MDNQIVESKSLIKMTPVVNVDFLDRALITNNLEICYCPDNGIEQSFIEWDTEWNFSKQALEISNHLVSKGIPKGVKCLLKIF